MNAFNRVFLTMIALVWLAGLAGVLYLIWESRALSIDTENLVLNFEIVTASQAEQILATLIAAVLALPALALLLAEFRPRRGQARETVAARDYDRLQERVDTLQQRLDTERPVTRVEPVERVEGVRPEHYEAGEPRPRRRWGFLERSHR